MSATLVARNLGAGHGARPLFTDLDLVVAPGDVIGLVGVNGAGKSTLLRLLAGQIPAEEGSVTLTPSTASVGYLAQEPDRRAGESVFAFLERRSGVTAAQARMDRAAQALSASAVGPSAESGEDYPGALDQWLALGGADFQDRVQTVAADVGLAVGLDAPMTSLSGGQAARAALAALLLSRYDVFLLDEPTNDLDLEGLAQLERFVAGLRVGCVVVSHDREFLARTVTAVLELDLAQQRVGLFGGGYDAYLVEREVQRRHSREQYDEYSDRRGALTERAQTQRAWMAKGVRNARRKSPDNDKIGRAFRTESSEKQAAKARQTQRLIERLEVVDEPRKEWQLQMTIAAAPRSGSVVAVVQDAVVRRGTFTLGPVSAQVGWADRIAVTGANGSGKSTLLGALLGRIDLDAGRSWLGPGVVVGEVDQTRRLFDVDESLMSVFAELLPDMVTADVRTALAKFGLRADHVHRAARSLSPGERTRAALALLQERHVNLLVLDEPTNHLDLAAIEQLEPALESFPGTVLLVTHDRRMLETVRLTRHWRVDRGRLNEDI